MLSPYSQLEWKLVKLHKFFLFVEVGKLDSDYLNDLERLVQTKSNLDHGKGARYEVKRI